MCLRFFNNFNNTNWRLLAWVELFLRKDVAFRAFKIALIVGVILAGINHGDHIIKGEMTGNNWIKIMITFCVPYCVSSFSSVMAIKKEQNISTM